MTELEEKMQFAKAMIKANMAPLAAGQIVHPNLFSRAAQIASMWPDDPEVKGFIKKLSVEKKLEEGTNPEEEFIVSHLKKIIENSRYEDNKLKSLELLMRVNNLDRSKNSTSSTVNQTVYQKVIEVPKYETRDEWQADVLENQRALKSAKPTIQ